MTLFGKYDAAFEAGAGSLFVYGESPLASAKLNRWHGNIEGALHLIHRLVRVLAADDSEKYLIGPQGDEPLKVEEQSPPDLTVRVSPGLALGPSYLVGLSESAVLPEMGTFTPPTANPRIDVIGARETGEWVILTGTEDASPTAPELDDDTIPLAEIYFRVGSASIQNTDDSSNAYITDRRPRRLPTFAHRHAGPASPAEAPDGVRTEFSTDGPFVPGSLRVYVNGLQQIPGVHYEEDEDGEGYVFASAPPAGSVVHHEYQPG